MEFDSNNEIIRLCVRGMEMEGQGNPDEAARLFNQAWENGTNDFEKFTAAHYVARHQKSVTDKLKWDEAALNLALKLSNPAIQAVLPSLYLNIAKCYEDLNDGNTACKNYELALSYTGLLPDDGYGKMIKAGIGDGIERNSGNNSI